MIILDTFYCLWLLFVGFLAYVTFLDAQERGTLTKAEIYLC